MTSLKMPAPAGASLAEAASEIGLKVATVGPVALDGTDKTGKAVIVPGHASTLATAFTTEIGLEISPVDRRRRRLHLA